MASEKDTKKNAEGMTMEEMQAAFAKMMEEAKAEAAKIVEAAKDEAKKIVDEAKMPAAGEKTSEEQAAEKAYLNESVKIKLFKDTGKYKDDVFVSCNGEAYAIKRGIEVEVPRKIAMILEQSYNQDIETSEMMEAKSAEFDRATRANQ